MDLKNHKETIELFRTHAWDYFSFHGNQRITLFRYYILFLTLYFTAISLFVNGFRCSGVSTEIFTIVISVFFMFATKIFQLLDSRSDELIKISEDALIKVESTFFTQEELKADNSLNKIQIFEREKYERPCITHGRCFNGLFICAYIIASGFILWSTYSLSMGNDDCSTKKIEIVNFVPGCQIQN